jgi:3-isopropylmalate/(R)-2-methylmalate dehydratase small subunit
MGLEKFSQVIGRGVVVPGNDIDTDRIIPARFLKCVTFDALAEGLFADDRKAAAVSGGVHSLEDDQFRGATIMLTGANFGCGSSREHAPQAIRKFGIRAIIAENYAEIFFGNSTNIGLPCVSAARESIQKIAAAVEKNPQLEIAVDLENEVIRYGDESVAMTMRDSARDALIAGRWDTIAELLEGAEAVNATAVGLPYMASTD